jgi:hypothetical protein
VLYLPFWHANSSKGKPVARVARPSWDKNQQVKKNISKSVFYRKGKFRHHFIYLTNNKTSNNGKSI